MVRLIMLSLSRLLPYSRNLTTLTRTISTKTHASVDHKVPDNKTTSFSIHGHHGAVYTKAKDSDTIGQNQDGAIIHKDGIALCDAMGGFANGVEMKERFLKLISQSKHLPPKKEAFIETFSSLSEGGICGTILNTDPQYKDRASIMLFGDMKFLRIREGKIIQESQCDYKEFMAGKIDQDTYEQRRHIVDGALTIKSQKISWPKVQLYPFHDLTPNDTIVLCSDGISDCIPSSVIGKLISEMTTEQSIEKILKFHQELKDIDSSQNRFFTTTDQLNDLYIDNDLDPLIYYPPFKLDDVVLAISKPG